jgi:hypothetical protein
MKIVAEKELKITVPILQSYTSLNKYNIYYFIKYLEKLNLPNTLWVSAVIPVTPSTEKSNDTNGKLKMIKITKKNS